MMEEYSSALERIKAKEELKQREKDLIAKNEEQFKQALNAVAATDSGLYVLRAMLNRCGVFIPDTGATAAQRYDRSLLRDFYLTTVRQYLDKDLIHKLEV